RWIMTLQTYLCLFTLAVVAIPVAAQTPQDGRITLPEVEVRAGASPKFPVTGKLRMGDMVQVKQKVNDYLEIVPPAGSLSWIPDRLVKQVTPNALELVVPEAPVRYGAAASAAPLEIESRAVRAKQGSRLVIRGEKVTYDRSAWWPIEPIPGESR